MQGTQEMGVQFLGQEDHLEEENGNTLQYFCLINPMDRKAWWAIVIWSQKVRYACSDLAHVHPKQQNLKSMQCMVCI